MSKQFIFLEDCNKISYKTYGQGNKIILFFHGLVGGSYLGDEWIKEIENVDVTLIAIERSGYGASSKIEMESISQWVTIAKQLTEQLDIEECDIIGCSAGAPFAYATAYALGNRVKNIHILGGVPVVYMEYVLRHYTPENQEQYKTFLSKSMEDIQKQYLTQLNGFIDFLNKNGEEYIIKTVEENLKQDCFGMAQESKLQIQEWKIPLSEIKQPVTLYHARADEMVPYKAAKEMLQYLNNSSFVDIKQSDGNAHIESIGKTFIEIIKQYA